MDVDFPPLLTVPLVLLVPRVLIAFLFPPLGAHSGFDHLNYHVIFVYLYEEMPHLFSCQWIQLFCKVFCYKIYNIDF